MATPQTNSAIRQVDMSANKGPGWHQPNNLMGYHQRVYSQRKVGHVIHDGRYLALHDGIYLGVADTLEEAQKMVDERATP